MMRPVNAQCALLPCDSVWDRQCGQPASTWFLVKLQPTTDMEVKLDAYTAPPLPANGSTAA
jgi:hypothetical protein